jgi:hypothetical protein
MTWTYSGDPASSALDAIRFLVGDTDTTDQLLSDEEIAWINYEQSGSSVSTTDLYYSAHYACHAIGAKLARLADTNIGDLRITLSQKAQGYRALATDLMVHANRQNAPIPYAGGISVSDKQIDLENSDLDRTYFKSGQFQDVRDGGRTQTITGIQYFGPGADR